MKASPLHIRFLQGFIFTCVCGCVYMCVCVQTLNPTKLEVMAQSNILRPPPYVAAHRFGACFLLVVFQGLVVLELGNV